MSLDWTTHGGEAELHVILACGYLITKCRSIESILKDIFLPKSKQILVGVLHRPSDKPEFIEYLNNSLK